MTLPATIPRRMLADLDMPEAAKRLLARGLCPECLRRLQVVDTWERECSCGWRFQHATWPMKAAPLPPC